MREEEKIVMQCEISIDKFKKRVLPITWTARSILLSEGFAFCAICDLLNIDMILESGIYNGRSTLIWAKYFGNEKLIKATDIKIRKEAKIRLKDYNIELIEGDSRNIFPELLMKYRDKRIGIFIDGPKGNYAVKLAKKCLIFDNVAFVGIHDMHKTNIDGITPLRERVAMDNLKNMKFYTDELWFVKRYSGIDKEEGNPDEEQKLIWQPYEYLNTDTGKIERKLGSYGPTIGFLFNTKFGFPSNFPEIEGLILYIKFLIWSICNLLGRLIAKIIVLTQDFRINKK